MTCTKPKSPPTVADRLAALEKRVSAIENELKATPPPVIPWWEAAYPEAYPKQKGK